MKFIELDSKLYNVQYIICICEDPQGNAQLVFDQLSPVTTNIPYKVLRKTFRVEGLLRLVDLEKK